MVLIEADPLFQNVNSYHINPRRAEGQGQDMNLSIQAIYPHMQYNYLLNIIILKKMAFSMTTLNQDLFQEQNQTYSITLSTLFPNEIDNNDELQFLHVFESSTLEQHMEYLKRYHLEVKHIPEIKLSGNFHKNIEITMRVYDRTLLNLIKRYTHQEKIDCCIKILKTYRSLISEYGFFLITHNHIRVDSLNSFVLWINEDYKLNHPSLPIQNTNQRTELYAVNELIKIIKQYYTTDFFKYRKIQTFDQLSSYLQFIKKRNKIHKNCGNKARQESETKRRTTLSVRDLENNHSSQKQYDRYRPTCSYSTLLGSNIINRRSRDKQSSQSFLKSGSMSRIQVSKDSNDSKKMKSEFDTTIVSSELKNTRNMSYLQLSNIIQKSQKKSCVFGSNPEVVQEKSIKHSSVLTKECESKRINTHFCPIQYKRKTEKTKQSPQQKIYKSLSIEKENSLQIDLSNLLLSQINQDPQNETGGSELRRKQHLIEEFETLFYN